MGCGKIYLFCITLLSLHQLIASDYAAAVVEYQPLLLATPNETVESNLNQYIFYIEQAKLANVQIIVFPEYGLTGDIDDPTAYAIEIPNTGDGPVFTNFWLQKLSSTAVAHSLYVVLNLVEQTTNSTNETIYYNTNLVFDKAGKIAAKYRKINLFDEPRITPGVPAENQVTFSTDFGVTFGIFTCYDLTFDNPSRTILANSNVTDIVFPTAWNSFLPFYHSLSMQYGYAAANEVNLLAADFNAPQVGMGGSGIYGADGSIFSYYLSGRSGSKMLMGIVKNTPRNKGLGGSKAFDGLDDDVPVLAEFNASRLFESEKYSFKTLNMSQINIKDEICHKSFCCQFNINVSSTAVNSSEVYKIMAYSGPVQLLNRTNQRICALVACETSDSSTCAKQSIKLQSKFGNILVESDVSNNEQEYYQPISLTTNLVPVFNSTYNSTVVNDARKLTFRNEFEQDNLLAFGIIGSDANASVYSIMLLIGVLFLNYVFY